MNRVSELLKIKYPIIQAGMVWCSGWELASVSSNSGVLGIIGAGSMYPEILLEHIHKCKKATSKPFGINIPMLYPQVEDLIDIVISENIPVVITSAGNPAKYTQRLKSHGITVLHVVSNSKFAKKAEAAGVDAVIAEGFEAGGHNGREETTTMCLVPEIITAVSIPVIAAGGIGSGAAMLAAMCLGAHGVQIGSRFAASKESSAHINYKNKIVEAKEGDTILTLKEVTPVRLIKNDFYFKVLEAKNSGASPEILKNILGKGRAKKGIFEGDLKEGEIEIGQVSASINSIQTVSEIVKSIILDYNLSLERLKKI